MNGVLEAMLQRRAVKVFEPVEISRGLREQILDAARHAPSSFNMQPYRFDWVGSTARKAAVAKLCLGQTPAKPHRRWSWSSHTSDRCLQRRGASWSGCAGAGPAKRKSATMNGQQRSAESCSC